MNQEPTTLAVTPVEAASTTISDFAVLPKANASEEVVDPVALGTSPRARKKNLIVEGWRFLAHSYALVNQWQLLALLRRSDIDLSVKDVPFSNRRWTAQTGIFDENSEAALRALPTATASDGADATLRIAFPFDFSVTASRRTAVFVTLENQLIRRSQLPNSQAYERLQRGPPRELKVVTPSHWSAEGLYKAGFDKAQVCIIPHGVDVKTFHPMPQLRSEIREGFPVAESDFVFLSIGAMTGNKGIDLLIRAFAVVCREFPHARLILKGMDPLYRSQELMVANLQMLSSSDRQQVADRINYFGDSLSNQSLALLYQVADTYVSPYRAEGFNLPVLEAAACGVPIICTDGGATDDFVEPSFARRINSRKVNQRQEDEDISRLEPDLDHLIELMRSAIIDAGWRSAAAESGPEHVAAKFTWDKVVDGLVQQLIG